SPLTSRHRCADTMPPITARAAHPSVRSRTIPTELIFSDAQTWAQAESCPSKRSWCRSLDYCEHAIARHRLTLLALLQFQLPLHHDAARPAHHKLLFHTLLELRELRRSQVRPRRLDHALVQLLLTLHVLREHPAAFGR